MFAGSDAIYLLRKTEDGLPTVEKIYHKEASTPFVSLNTEVISTYDNAEKAVPHTVNYESGDILVYISDGLLDRQTVETETEADSIRTLLPRLLTAAVLRNRDRDFF